MEYVVGSVAALVSGNITPSRPRGLKRAATPVKHQTSPNITPKSELVNDRSIFMSPTTQKKKAIVKKSPKRIFQNPDLDVTDEKENLMSPKADKVKKHLTDKLDEGTTSKSKKLKSQFSDSHVPLEIVPNEEAIPKKSKKRKVSDNSVAAENIEKSSALEINQEVDLKEIKKKNKKSRKSKNECDVINQDISDGAIEDIKIQESEENTNVTLSKKKKKKMKKSKSKLVLLKNNETDLGNSKTQDLEVESISLEIGESKKKKRKTKPDIPSPESPYKKTKVNPNAITNKDTDSEHESDNEIVSENDEKMNDVLENDKSASEDDEDEAKSNKLKPKKKSLKELTDTKEAEAVVHDPDEVNRTLFVGNVPFSKKCKKEIKKIFSSYGEIETVRIRSVPVKDPRFTPKLAVIRGELHPERCTVNVYVKFKSPDSVQQALVENGRSLGAGHTARVSPCAAPAHGTALGAAPAHDTTRGVFVGNVPFASSDDDVRALFVSCGAVSSVRLVRDGAGVGKGFGYVNFESKDSVELALALTPAQLTLKNRELRVKRCTVSQRDRDRHSRGGAPGHSRGGAPGHSRGGAPGHSRGGAPGHSRGGMRGRGHGGMRGGGQRGMRGGGGHRGMRGGATRPDDTRTDGQGAERQGAFRRLEHKKKKIGGEYVGLTPDTRTKPKVKPSRKKKALAEIMSKQ